MLNKLKLQKPTHGIFTGLIVAWFAFSVSSARAESTSEPYSNGGAIGAPAIIAQYNKSGERFRIKGYCRSSCTQLLAIRTVCVEPNATLAFHAAILGPTIPVSPERNARMASFYRPALRKYVIDNHWMDSWDFHTISGSDIIHKFGYPECKG